MGLAPTLTLHISLAIDAATRSRLTLQTCQWNLHTTLDALTIDAICHSHQCGVDVAHLLEIDITHRQIGVNLQIAQRLITAIINIPRRPFVTSLCPAAPATAVATAPIVLPLMPYDPPALAYSMFNGGRKLHHPQQTHLHLATPTPIIASSTLYR